MFTKTCLAGLIFLLAWDTPCIANNNLFLPGDAFFPTVLTRDDLVGFAASRPTDRTINYVRIDSRGGAFCGWAGFDRAVIATSNERFAQNLMAAYDRLRELQPRMLREIKIDGKLARVETNGMRVLFYPKDFDFQKYHLGVTYNESWMDQIEAFGHERRHVRFSSLVNSAEAVAHCWRDGPLIPPMPAKIPEIKLGQKEQAPITIDCPVKAIVLANGTLDDFFDSDGEKYLRIYVVSSEGIEEWLNHQWEWKRVH